MPVDVSVLAEGIEPGSALDCRLALDSKEVADLTIRAGERTPVPGISFPDIGTHTLEVRTAGASGEASVRVISGFWNILLMLVAICPALAFRQVRQHGSCLSSMVNGQLSDRLRPLTLAHRGADGRWPWPGWSRQSQRVSGSCSSATRRRPGLP